MYIYIHLSQSIWHTLIAQLPLPFKDNQEPVSGRQQHCTATKCRCLTVQSVTFNIPDVCRFTASAWSLGRGIPASAGTPSQRHLGLFMLLLRMPPKAFQFHWIHYFTATQARAKAWPSSAPSAILLKSAPARLLHSYVCASYNN